MPAFYEVTTDGVPKLKKRAENALMAKSMRFIAFGWWAKPRPKHFTPAGARMYGYGRRATKDVRTGSVKRTKRGKPRSPSGRPLTWSGRSFELSRQKKITGTSRRSAVSMPIRAFNFRPPKNRQLNMTKEFRTVLENERKGLEKDGARDLEERLAKYRVTSRVTIRG